MGEVRERERGEEGERERESVFFFIKGVLEDIG